jgi:hypothetical protein
MMRSLLLICVAAPLAAQPAAGVKWTVPSGWKNEGSRPMRAATYSVPLAPGDAGAAECVVYFFGAGQGGSVEANLERWKGQFREAGGKPPAAKIEKRTIHGLPVTLIDVAGEYSGMGGPNAAQQTSVPGYRLLGAIVEGPGGNLFVKFTAPQKTVAANKAKFDELVGSMERER